MSYKLEELLYIAILYIYKYIKKTFKNNIKKN